MVMFIAIGALERGKGIEFETRLSVVLFPKSISRRVGGKGALKPEPWPV